MVQKNSFLVLLILFCSINCTKFSWNNPFDPDCPKELFSPSNLIATQEGLKVKLTWQQNNTNISGFNLFKSINGSPEVKIADIGNSTTQYSDTAVRTGIKYSYKLFAYANSNNSIPLKTDITLEGSLPKVITNTAVYISGTNGYSSVHISDDGGSAIIAKGIIWSTSGSPTVDLLTKTNNLAIKDSRLECISGLKASTKYYLRAYATNSIGTAYGDQIMFTTLNINSVSDIDGNFYNIIEIGGQFWMSENLKTTKFSNGDTIPHESASNKYPRGYTWYNDDIFYKNKYGAIYNFYISVDNRKIAPTGWHVPSEAEWIKLINNLGGGVIAGDALKESGNSNWKIPSTTATNLSGFSALPGGVKDCSNSFVKEGTYTQFTIDMTPQNGLISVLRLQSSSSEAQIINHFDCNAGSVRCIKD